MKHGEITRQMIGCAFDVHNELGGGFLEQVYENALAMALRERGLLVVQQAGLNVRFRGRVVGEYRADLNRRVGGGRRNQGATCIDRPR
jgi:GxxExxY protein